MLIVRVYEDEALQVGDAHIRVSRIGSLGRYVEVHVDAPRSIPVHRIPNQRDDRAARNQQTEATRG